MLFCDLRGFTPIAARLAPADVRLLLDTYYEHLSQIVFAHDGSPFLSYESRIWLLDDDGAITGPGPRETGFWRPQPDGTLEVLIVHSPGLVTPYSGRARNLTSWEMETWALVRTETAPAVERSTRLYGVVRGDLAYVDEREYVDHAMAPYVSAQLGRIAG